MRVPSFPLPERAPLSTTVNELVDLLEEAWVLLANVDGGDWSEQSELWQKKANEFRIKVLGGDARPEPPPLKSLEEE